MLMNNAGHNAGTGHDPPTSATLVLHSHPYRLQIDEYETEGRCGPLTILTILRPAHGDRPQQVQSVQILTMSREQFLEQTNSPSAHNKRTPPKGDGRIHRR